MTPLGLHSSPQSSYEDLLRVIRRVRTRWRTRRLILGVTMVGVAAVLVVGVSSAAMDALLYAPWVVRGLQAAAWLALGVAVWRFLVRPLRFRVTDQQVALYVEEHDPTLREAVISGVELGRRSPTAGADGDGISTDLTRLVVEEAIRRLETLKEGRLVEASGLRRAGGALATVGGVAIVASLLAPSALLRGAALLLTPWADITDANPYRIHVEPGNAAVARDSDRWVEARLEGFTAARVDLRTRVEGTAVWESIPMLPDPEDGAFRHLLLGIPDATDYYVDADGVLSPTFRIEVEDVPYVAQIGLTYRYPDHTGLSPREVEDGGDIAAVAGTVVELEVIPTVPAAAGVLRLEPGPVEIALEAGTPEESPSGAGSEVLTATLTLAETGSYRVALAGPDKNLRTASRDYLIEVLEDMPPIVRFVRPGRDSQANPVEEVFVEVLAEDDYAVRRLEMRVSVNGGEETREVLAAGGAREEIQSGHTLFLEEHDLVPGDLVSYYAVARDGAGAEASTDMFFIAVKPFDRTYRQGDAMPGGGGGAGDGLDGTLSMRQKQVVVATFKVLRDREGMPASAVTETVATIGLAQGRLREQVETLTRRLRNRGIGASPEFAEIVDHLDAGLVEMTVAEELLVSGEPEDALPREQKALTHLQRADAVFRDVQIAFGQGGGGGGGGGAPPVQAEDLANLFELEMDKLRNQYETVEQQQRSSADNEVDEVLQRLAELARRQEQENERIRRGVRPSGGGAGSAQNQLAAETEDVARRLERLARERSRPDLAAVSRRLRDAAQDMRSASGGNSGEGLESALSAANALRGARRDLDGQRRARLGRDVDAALDETRRLRTAQDRIRSAVQDLEEERSREAIASVSGQKQDLAERVQRLEQRLDEVSRDWSRDEPEASRAVGEAADGIRDRKLKEKIHYSRGVAAQRSPEYADQFESMIAGDLEALEQDLSAAREAVEGSDRAGRDDVLDRAASLVRGLEAMRNRLADRGEQSESQSGSQSESQSESPSESSSGSGQEGSREGQGGRGGTAGGREARQLQRELERRTQDAEALRRELTGIGPSGNGGAERLGQVVSALRGLNPERLTGDPRGMEILEAEVLDTLRQLEFELRRALAGGSGADVLTGSEDRAPEGYREMVEEYFRALSRQPE